MPSILNLKFKGNKSFVAFSNLSDVDALTRTWKVCTKVASYLEQGQRLENLSWRLWHLQNLMVDTDNAKSKREFKKLSKHMSDKLDKEKGRSIEELEAPDFRRNHSTDMIRQRAVEKERSREASQNAKPGTIKRMQFTFSVDQPTPVTAQSVKKPDLKPSPEFNKRLRPSAHISDQVDEQMVEDNDDNDADPPLTQRGRRDNDISLRFPPLFSNDFGPAALLYPSPTLTTPMNYGEGLNAPISNDSDGFSIPRPTIELTLDELLNGVDSPRPWSPAFFSSSNAFDHNDEKSASSVPLFSTTSLANNNSNNSDSPVFYLPNTNKNLNEDVVMQSVPITTVSGNSFGTFGSFDTSDADDSNPDVESDEESSDSVDLMSTTTLSSAPPINEPKGTPALKSLTSPKVKSVKTVSSPGRSTTPRPNLTVRTSSNASTRSSIPSATATALPPSFKAGRGGAALNNNSAPGGQKAECSNCGATHTPLWRRGLNDELNCNACGLYCKLHKRPRPKTMRNQHGEGRAQNSAPRPEAVEVMAQCYNCHTTATPLWRKDDEGKTVCNACGLYYKLHGSARPISMKSDVIRKRSRHDARRGTNGSLAETPSASPGVSRRASPARELSPTLAPDSSTASSQVFDYSSSPDDMDYSHGSTSQSELLNALGGTDSGANANGSGGSSSASGSAKSSSVSSESGSNHTNNSNMYQSVFGYQFPGPYHPDHLSQYSFTPPDALPFPSGDYEPDLSLSPRTNKRRRMSSDSASEPPSSVVSFSSFAEGGYSTSSSATSHSQRSSISALASEFPFSSAFNNINNNNNSGNQTEFNKFSNQIFRGSANAFWHPPMMLKDNHTNNDSSSHNSYVGLHPPMLPPQSEDSPMDYLHPPMMIHDDDTLFSTYLHPPMSLPSDDNSSSSNNNGNGNSNGGSGNVNAGGNYYGLDMRIY
ncbi:hypothetical protein BDP27DRAFT_1416219 [Rhodocollybia butyracea]|uniref:GATA-type domain-containing protein n=1 Tax=Rhodocollybia butyracea TaxID=206335 RepID=A0A9P5Q481_9AGAR|nr:hypothetical protein BDP27DRAFT_1416219 [Rhodocollybia butyracea]